MKGTRTPKGYVTKYGYRRVRRPGDRRLVMEHVLVWEQHHGPVPVGKEIHHKNRDKLDNRIENLQLVTRLEHKRIHSGCVKKSDGWWKPCRRCGEMKHESEYYRRHDGIMHMCKPCFVRRVVAYKRLRRARIAEEKARTSARAGDGS